MLTVKRRQPKAYFVTHRIADSFQGRFRRAFRDAVQDWKNNVSLGGLERAVRDGTGPENAIDWLAAGNEMLDRLEVVYRDILEASALAHLAEMPKRLVRKQAPVLEFAFDVTNPEALSWIEQHAAELVLGVREETRQAIRALVFRSFDEGIPPRKLARLIKDHIGLTRIQSGALLRFADQVEERMAEGVMNAERGGRLVDRYRNRMLRYRSNNIARTETMTASNRGQLELWRQMEGQGYLDPMETRRKWLITPDERLCWICAPIPSTDGNLVRMDQPFATPLGMMLNPPAHPSCRCSTRLVFTNERGEFQGPDRPTLPFRGETTQPAVPLSQPGRHRLKPKLPRRTP